MKLSLIVAPYDSGHQHSGFGRGPDAILGAGLVELLEDAGHEVTVEDIGKVGDVQTREIATGFAVCRAVAVKVAEARDEDRFPIVLTGNCLTANGAVAGERADAIVWFDQHGDINTPETSPYGFLDGMALSTTLGLCWKPMAATIPGFHAIDPARCVLVDARDLDPDEKALLATLPVHQVQCAEAAGQAAKLQAAGARRAHLHVDLDVHNPDELQVNRYTTAGGPGVEEVRQAVAGICRAVTVSGVTISAYDPVFDAKAEVPPVVGALLVEMLTALERI
jgi:arginase